MGIRNHTGVKVGDRVTYHGQNKKYKGKTGTVQELKTRKEYVGYWGDRSPYATRYLLEVAFDGSGVKVFASSQFELVDDVTTDTTVSNTNADKYMVKHTVSGDIAYGTSIDEAVRAYIRQFGGTGANLEAYGFKNLGKVVSKTVPVYDVA